MNTDTWNEYWYPFQNTDGVTFADLNGVFNVKRFKGDDSVFISPVSYIEDTLKIIDTKGHLIFEKPVKLQPLQTYRQRIPLEGEEQIGRILLAGSEVNLTDTAEKVLDRPLKPDADFDWSSTYGLYLRARYDAGTRHYVEAERFINTSLTKERYFMPTLLLKSYLQYRRMNYDSAFYFSRKALSIDTYDPSANYYYGLAALQLEKWYDALDGFQVAAITPEFRSAAYTELCKMQITKHSYKEAFHLASESLIYNSENVTALQLQYLAARLMDKQDEQKLVRQRILSLDPLNNFIRFEDYWQNKTENSKKDFTGLIRDELPQQTYLHLADWYLQLGLSAESESVLEVSPVKDDEIKYWLAYLHRNDTHAKEWLDSADAEIPLFVFPFRKESFKIMKWATQQTNDWKPKYYMGLLENYFGRKMKALQLLEKAAPESHFAPLFVTLARLRNPSDTVNILQDYTAAASLNKNDWRYGKYLTEFFLTQKGYPEALKSMEPYFKKDPQNYIVGMLYARCLILNNQYPGAGKVLDNIHILPFEGATSGHQLYKQTKLMLALQLLQQRKYRAALKKVSESREWPERLGEGKPYPYMMNDTLQNDIEKLIQNSKQTHRLNDVQINLYINMAKALSNINRK